MYEISMHHNGIFFKFNKKGRSVGCYFMVSFLQYCWRKGLKVVENVSTINRALSLIIGCKAASAEICAGERSQSFAH